MSNPFELDVVDSDGAIREMAEQVDSGTRRQMLQKAGLAGAGVVAGSTMFGGFASSALAAGPPKLPTSHKSKANDLKVLNFALTLEYLEAEFYVQAVKNKAPNTPALAAFAATVRSHELTHVKTLKTVIRSLGGKAQPKPSFNFRDTVTNSAKFAATSQVLEDTGVMAYTGQAHNLKTPALLTAAATILSVEARHASWIRFINSGGQKTGPTSPAPSAFDTPKSAAQIFNAVTKTKFITKF